jgi:hypothetical protein
MPTQVKDGVSKFRGDIKDKAIAIVAEKYLFHPRKLLPKSKEAEHISRKITSLIGTGLNAQSLSHSFHRGAPLENVSPINICMKRVESQRYTLS